MSLSLAIRNVFRHKARTAMTLAAIVFGVVGLILSGGFVEDVFLQLREATIHSRLGHIQIYREGYHENRTRAPYRHMIEEPAVFEELMDSNPLIEDWMQRLSFFGLVNKGGADIPIVGEGVEPAKEAELGSFFFLLEGRQLTNTDAHGILLGEGVAASLNISPGENVNLMVTMPDGGLNSLEFEVVGVFRTFSKDFDARAVRIALPAAKELMDINAVHTIVVSLTDTLATDRVADWLQRAVGPAGYELKTWIELDDFYQKTVELYRQQLGVLQVIILLVVLLSVANSVNMTAQERVGEFGTLKALGHTSRDIARLILLENFLLGLTGAFMGLVLGLALSWGISQVGIPMPPPPNANSGYTARIVMVPSVALTAFGIGLLATVLSSLFAARGASSVPITDALRRNV